ncbi:MAG: MYXO-CTERM domain-containing protein [Myxococcota bacterium]|jgi:MYXO-CTERM domain-containing protein
MPSILALALLAAPPAHAHGIWGHVHVTGWAVENMPDDELRQFLLEPEVFNALLFGAAFTDTGYAVDSPASRAYSEHTHWEPFIEDYVEWMRVNDPPPWDTLESRKRVAFLLGCGSHGLQDSIFDSLFLYQIAEHDGAGQDVADPATDGFLVLDEHVRFDPEEDLPMEMLLELYAGLDAGVTEEVIRDAVDLTTAVYVNSEIGWGVAEGLGLIHEPALPWTRVHYMDPVVPGSLRAEIFPTMRYQQALWKRLHGELSADEVTVFAYPEAPRRLLSHDPAQTSSWAALIFGAGVQYEDDLAELLGPDGAPVPFTQANTRWGADHTRLIRLLPEADLEPGGWYTARLRSGVSLIDGQVSTEPWELRFQVDCAEPDPDLCPDQDDIAVASTEGLPEPQAPTEDSPTETDSGADGKAASGGGCGCASASGANGWLALVGLGLLSRRSRWMI